MADDDWKRDRTGQVRQLRPGDNPPVSSLWQAFRGLDVTAADALSELDASLQAAGIELCFAEMKDPVKDKLKRFGLFKSLGEQTFFATLGQAVNAYLEHYPVEWVDWEDR